MESSMPSLLSPTPSEFGFVVGVPRALLRAEGVALALAAVALYAAGGHSWALFAALFLAPDLSFAAFLTGRRIGAAVYNILHSTVPALALAALGWSLAWPVGLAIALIWLAHVGFDRALGYGFKYGSGFSDTHLGRIGRARG
jgi:hypothetical protein